MKHKIKRRLILIVCAIFFIIFTSCNLYYQKYISRNLSSVSARYNKESVSFKPISKSLNNLKETDLPIITLWNRRSKELVQNGLTDLVFLSNVIEVNGTASQVIPMKFICGSNVYQGDEDGCVLDTKTAFHLFGTTHALNNKVKWNNREYIVRGVAKAADTMMLIQITDLDHLYSNIEAQFPHKSASYGIDNAAYRLEKLLIESGLDDPDAMIDGEVTAWLLNIIWHLPIWVIGFGLAFLLIRSTLEMNQSIILRSLYGIGTILIIAIMIKLADFRLQIPSQFIPTRWSDFNFYVNKFSEIKNSIDRIKTSMHMPKDILRETILLKCILNTVINLFLLWIICPLCVYTNENRRELVYGYKRF